MNPAPKPKPRAQKKRFHARRDAEYTDWVRRRTCIAFQPIPRVGYGPQHDGRIQCAHVRSRGAGGDDRANCVPLCAKHHAEQHLLGIQSFAAQYGLDLKAEAARLYQQYLAEVGRA